MCGSQLCATNNQADRRRLLVLADHLESANLSNLKQDTLLILFLDCWTTIQFDAIVQITDLQQCVL